jgi:hypothetical protein
MKIKTIIPKALRKKNNSSGKKKNQKNIELVPTLSGETNSIIHDERSQSSSSSNQSSVGNPIIKKYSKHVDGSSMSIFARMSTTIADTLSEEEFGKQRNSLYNPKTVGQSYRVVHPVICKRDIFLENVSPLKGKKGGRNIAYTSAETASTSKVKVQECRDDNISERSSANTARIENGAGRKRSKSKDRRQSIEIENNFDENVLPSYSITGSMLFRKNNQLKIETGRIAEIKPTNVVTLNPYRLYNAPVEQHYGKIAKELGKPPRYHHSISPSSTVSSLTMPADLDEATTPRSFLPQLENIEEFGDIMKSHDYETLKEHGGVQEI